MRKQEAAARIVCNALGDEQWQLLIEAGQFVGILPDRGPQIDALRTLNEHILVPLPEVRSCVAGLVAVLRPKRLDNPDDPGQLYCVEQADSMEVASNQECTSAQLLPTTC